MTSACHTSSRTSRAHRSAIGLYESFRSTMRAIRRDVHREEPTWYRAANFFYAGYTDMERKTPRYDYIPWVEGKHTRDAFRNGYAKRVRRLPKAKYWTVTGDRRERKRLMRLATWPLLDWHEVPHAGRSAEHDPDRH